MTGGDANVSEAANSITIAGAVRDPEFSKVAQTEVGSDFNDITEVDEVESANVV